ncbi:hypothetical protein V6N13_074769 [Hibiscus sabdariffa]|uniref:Uncharacterized protein n=1 Tax=Hibiscus sabdariffa TaxID=183260 RepID=A0ABR2U9F1_9ROSI
MSFIDESVSLSCNGSFSIVKVRELSWMFSVVDESLSNKDILNDSYGALGVSGNYYSADSMNHVPVNSKPTQNKNMEGLGGSRVGDSSENVDVLILPIDLLQVDKTGGRSINLEGANSMVLPEVEMVLCTDRFSDARHTDTSPLMTLDPHDELWVADSILLGSLVRVALDAVGNQDVITERALEDVSAMGFIKG